MPPATSNDAVAEFARIPRLSSHHLKSCDFSYLPKPLEKVVSRRASPNNTNRPSSRPPARRTLFAAAGSSACQRRRFRSHQIFLSAASEA